MPKSFTKISTRPVDLVEDEAFLFALYGANRRDLASSGLDEERLNVLLRMQYRSQTEGYRADHPGAEHLMILADEKQVGRMMVSRGPHRIWLVDISILPEFRCRGIGGSVIGELLNAAEQTHSVVLLHVLQSNTSALALYRRLGFVVTHQDELRLTMEWAPGGASKQDLKKTRPR